MIEVGARTEGARGPEREAGGDGVGTRGFFCETVAMEAEARGRGKAGKYCWIVRWGEEREGWWESKRARG